MKREPKLELDPGWIKVERPDGQPKEKHFFSVRLAELAAQQDKLAQQREAYERIFRQHIGETK